MSEQEPARVLILEDEAVLAFALEDMVLDLGYQVVGPALRVSDALAMVEAEQIDVAVLDVNIAGDRSFPVADELARHDIPYLFATGYGKEGIGLEETGVIVLAKPYRRDDIRLALERLLKKPT